MQNIESLVKELNKLEHLVLSIKNLPLTALKISGSRVTIAISTQNEEDIKKAQIAINEAKLVYKLYRKGKLAKPFEITNYMRIYLHKDYPNHYLLQE